MDQRRKGINISWGDHRQGLRGLRATGSILLCKVPCSSVSGYSIPFSQNRNAWTGLVIWRWASIRWKKFTVGCTEPCCLLVFSELLCLYCQPGPDRKHSSLSRALSLTSPFQNVAPDSEELFSLLSSSVCHSQGLRLMVGSCTNPSLGAPI